MTGGHLACIMKKFFNSKKYIKYTRQLAYQICFSFDIFSIREINEETMLN